MNDSEEDETPTATPSESPQASTSPATSLPRKASAKSRSLSGESTVTFQEESFEKLPSMLQCRRLPVVVFSDEADEQRVWHGGSILEGAVHLPSQEPDVLAKNPVVMSPAYLGFAIEPSERRYLHYHGVGIVFARPRGGQFMQPSIDTILVCRALVDVLGVQNGADTSDLQISRVVDVGSGSGFIGKFAAAHAPGTGELSVTLVDVDPEAMEYCKSKWFNQTLHGRNGRPVSWHLNAEDAVELLEKDPGYDLLVSNPPYIPTRQEAEGAVVSRPPRGFWEGIGLVVHLVDLAASRRMGPGARLVMMVTSITLKAPAVVQALEAAVQAGVRLRIVLEREIAWKAWYAGPSDLAHLLASPEERNTKRSIAGCDFFVGATPPGDSRSGTDGRDRLFGYHWHMAYVLELGGPLTAL